MRGGARLFAAAAAGAIAACSSQGTLEVRPIGAQSAAADAAVPEKIAEGHAQLALGNAGLALELFRKALRGDPGSAEANAGIAMCYDRMNRFDLSRRYYEAALAIAPADTRLLERLALSLDRQGARDEAADVRREIAMRHDQAVAASTAEFLPPAIEAAVVAAPVAPKVAEILTPIAPKMAVPAPKVGPPVPPRPPVPAAISVAQPAPKLAEPEPPPAAPAAKVPPSSAVLAAAAPAPRPAPYEPAVAARPAPELVPAVSEKPAPARVPAASPATVPELAAATVAPHAPAASVTVALPEARPGPPAAPTVRSPVQAAPAPVKAAPAPVATAAAVAAVSEQLTVRRASESSPRLERMSPAEVTLLSKGVPQWRPHVVAKTAQSTTIRFVPLKSAGQAVANVRLLNAARHRGLAARTRQYLAAKGWRRLAIGDAPEARDTSVIYYPESRRRTAEILAAQFRIRVARRVAEGSGIVMLLGRDAARSRVGGRNA